MKFPNGPVVMPDKVPSVHLEKKNELLEGLDKQVKVLMGILGRQQVLAETSFEELIPALEKEEDIVFDRFDKEVLDRYIRYIEKADEIIILDDEIDFIEDDLDIENGPEDVDSDALDQLYGRRILLSSELKALETTDVTFLSNMHFFFTRLKDAARRTHETRSKKQSPGDTSVYLDSNNTLCGRFSQDDISKVEEDSFSTAFTIKEEVWVSNPQNKKAYGFFVPETDYLFIREGLRKRDAHDTLRHERMHHMLDGLARFEIFFPSKMIRDKVKRILKLKKGNVPGVMIEGEMKRLLGQRFAERLINSTQNEFLANYEDGKRLGFGQVEARLVESTFGKDENPERRRLTTFKHIAQFLSTAGVHLLEGHDELAKAITVFEQEGLGEYVDEAKKQLVLFEELLVKMIEETNSAGKYSSIIGEDADVEVKALLILLLPTKYHHIDAYLRHEHEESMSFIDLNKKFFFDKFINKETLEQFANSMESKWEVMPDKVKERLYNVFVSYLEKHQVEFRHGPPEYNKELLLQLLKIERLAKGVLGEDPHQGALAQKHFINALLSAENSPEDFSGVPDNFFDTLDAGVMNSYLSSINFQEGFEEEYKKELLALFKRVGLLE